ncbi:MAG: riboflavin biosynthesis protein RibF [Bacilli bacterium]
MVVYTLSNESIPTIPYQHVMCVGFFDGVHIGHQHVLQTTVAQAKQRGVRSSCMTFFPHPKEVLQKTPRVDYLTTIQDKVRYIEQFVDDVFLVTFDEHFSSLYPQQFVDSYFIGLGAVHIVAGFDFTYGRYGKGTMESLPFHCRQMFDFTVVEKVDWLHEKISSTRIRQHILMGEVDVMTSLLGRNYSVSGPVVQGDQRGRTIGFPTANVATNPQIIVPETGVYATYITVKNKKYSSVCNIGYKPTFHTNLPTPTVEVHIFDFDEDIYGEVVEVNFVEKIRDEKKFASIDDLVAQITADKNKAMHILAAQ